MKALTGQYYRLVASALMILSFVLFTLFMRGMLSGVSADLTESRLYTVSDSTRAIMRDLSEPISLTLVYSSSVGQDYPAVRAYAERVRQLLATYKSLAGNGLQVVELNPLPFSEAEDEALAVGLTAVDTDGPDPLYFGLIGRNAVDDELVIPFLAPERETSVEYDLTRMINRLDNPVPATVGLLSALPGMAARLPEQAYQVRKEIGKSFELETLPANFVEIPDTIDILMIAHPPRLTEFQTYLLDQFLLETGRALILLDPASKTGLASARLGDSDEVISSDLSTLLIRYGVRLSDQAVADSANALPVSILDDAGRQSFVGQPLFIQIGPGAMDRDDPITSVLRRSINIGAPGAIEIQDSTPLNIEILAQTGDRPSYIDPRLAARNATPEEVISVYRPESGPFPIMVRMSGTLPTAFPSGPVSPPQTGDPVIDQLARTSFEGLPAHRAMGAGRAEIILISDADLLDDVLYIDPSSGVPLADNASLILNALDNLSGGADLVDLRSRAPGLRPMTRIVDMREAAEAAYFEQQASLEGELSRAVRRLEELQQIGATGDFYSGDLEADLTDAERAEMIELRQTLVQTRAQLRAIQRDYRKQIDGLERQLSLLNIYAAPLLVGLIGFLILWRRQRRTRGGA